MVAFDLQDVLPLPRDRIWELLWDHLDEPTVRRIHPWILAGAVVHEGDAVVHGGRSYPTSRVVERRIRVGGRVLETTWGYRIRPPDAYDYEIAGPGVSIRLENAYADTPGGTRITTRANVSFRGVPSFLQGWVARRILSRADREDLAYLRKRRP